MRTLYHRQQNVRDCYASFILYNLKLAAADEFDWPMVPAEPDDDDDSVTAAETDEAAKIG